MFVDPQSVTVSGVAKTLPRVSVGDRTARYAVDDDTLQLTMGHQTSRSGRVRRQVRLDYSKIAADPFSSTRSIPVSGSVYLVIDEPADGSYTNAELLANAKALLGWATDANVTKLLAGES